jgi:hypothetical protein
MLFKVYSVVGIKASILMIIRSVVIKINIIYKVKGLISSF